MGSLSPTASHHHQPPARRMNGNNQRIQDLNSRIEGVSTIIDGMDNGIRIREARIETLRRNLDSLTARKSEQERRMAANNCWEQGRAAALRGNASGTMGLPHRGWVEKAERNFRAAEMQDHEVARLTGNINYLRLQLDDHVREMERTRQDRSQMIWQKQQLEAKVAELVSQLAAGNS